MTEDAGVRIGLEVHAYVMTASKLFCPCDADFLASTRANTNVCPTCTAQPGAKPMAPNRAALEAAIRLGRALGGTIQGRARFLRKHYFYPDLPANYQRTSEPIVVGGTLEGVTILEIHVEEDPGAYDPETGLVDDNRAGAPLLEIVTEPDIASPAHARRFLDALRIHLDHLGIGRAEAGLKVDCNLSVHGGERAEVKNVNSTRNVERALAHELERQLAQHARGVLQSRETRHFDEATGTTRAMRTKESEADYRYAPDPDLAPIDVADLLRALPPEESPFARRDRIARALDAAPEDVEPLVGDRHLLDALEHAMARATPRTAFQFYLRDVRGELGYRGRTFAQSGIHGEDVAALVAALDARRLTPQVATRILRAGVDAPDRFAAALASELSQGHAQEDAIAQAARAAIEANPKAVADHRAGKPNAIHFLVGQTMKALRGRADAEAVRAAVESALADN